MTTKISGDTGIDVAQLRPADGDPVAITIAADGKVTFPQNPVIGEVVSAQKLFAARTAIVSGNPTAAVTLSLPAGTWDVQGRLGLATDPTTSVSRINCKLSGVVGTILQDDPGAVAMIYAPSSVLNTATNGNVMVTTGVTRITHGSTQDLYLVANSNFTVAAAAVFGDITARRVA